jgi:hypothetical protein
MSVLAAHYGVVAEEGIVRLRHLLLADTTCTSHGSVK